MIFVPASRGRLISVISNHRANIPWILKNVAQTLFFDFTAGRAPKARHEMRRSDRRGLSKWHVLLESPALRAKTFWIVAVGLACFVECLGASGWLAWQRAAGMLVQDPESGAQAIIDSFLIDSPSAVLRSRRFIASDLAFAEPGPALQALEGLGARQCRHMPAAPYGFLNTARAGLIDGRLNEGRDDLEEALLRDPKNPFALRLLGLLLRFQGRSEEALGLFAEAECVAPGYRLPPVELAAEDNQWIRLEGLRRRLDAYPRIRIETMVDLSAALRRVGRIDEARSMLEDAAGDPRADLLRIRWLIDEKQTTKAAQLARGLVGRLELPSSIRANAWALLAAVLEIEGDGEGALAAAQRALHLDSSSAEPFRALARIAEGRGDYEEALQYCRRAWGIDPSNLRILDHLARVAEVSGYFADAQLALERAVELAPDDTRWTGKLVDFHFRHGGYMEAALALSAALDRHPADPTLLNRAERLRREVARR